MSRRFRKRDDLHKVIIPGVGLVRDNQILEGDRWGQFVPTYLVELLDSTPTAPRMNLLVDAPVHDKQPSMSDNGELHSDLPLLVEVAPPTKRSGGGSSRSRRSK